MEESRAIMSPGDVSALLQIKESTLRKYSLLLENVGYSFQRNNQNQRWYNDTDIVALKKFISLKNSTDMSLKDCAEAVILWSNGQSITPPSTVSNSDTERYGDDITELKELILKQNTVIKELVEQVQQQQKYIENRLDQRDELLMQSIRESQETKQLLLATKEEQEKKPRKGLFKWFGKE